MGVIRERPEGACPHYWVERARPEQLRVPCHHCCEKDLGRDGEIEASLVEKCIMGEEHCPYSEKV